MKYKFSFILNYLLFICSDEIINLLKLSIDNCEEGIVVKDPFSIYKPNSRKAGWYKIKPEVHNFIINKFIL